MSGDTIAVLGVGVTLSDRSCRQYAHREHPLDGGQKTNLFVDGRSAGTSWPGARPSRR